MKTTMLVAAVLATLAGCSFDIANPNSPDPIGNNPARNEVAAAATGLLIGSEVDAADFALDLGILGREAYRFDGSDPRFTGELLTGGLDAGSNAFGGDHWAEQYRTIRSANSLLAVIGTASALTPAEQNAVSGFARTIKALNFLLVVSTHTGDSIPIAVESDPTAAPAPFVTNAAAYAYIVALLDSAQVDLQNGGGSFPFSLSDGFNGFNDPASFILVNRALRARVNVYTGDFAGALTSLAASFIDTSATADLAAGAYHSFGTGPKETANALFQNPLAGENFAHPSLETDAQLQPGGALDQRFLDKTIPRTSTTVDNLTSALGWTRYSSPSAPIPIIRNEELILLRAEANVGLNQLAAATDDINYIRVHSGGLAPIAVPATPAAALDALLYEKRYSLLYEGGHRWIDLRRYGLLSQLPLDRAGDVAYPTYPVPRDEILARE
ncbi:MAG TPA: RagB/SusD family nutrient uptake outer membrane protein [Gemmatimonadales bacterium]|nr:RagB/SusD family nutrient uptake outer membrane protein [Gemmatimonadales bacterium]